jgi:hypothetical protein
VSIIKGKIETNREVAPKEISFGPSPATRDKDGKWTSDEADVDIVETSFEKLFEEMLEYSAKIKGER